MIPVAIGVIGWKWLYNGFFGLISGVLQEVGLVEDQVALLASKTSAFHRAVVTDVWVGVPMVTLFLLAAKQGVSRDLYEAAWVDGAGRWYRFRVCPVFCVWLIGSMLPERSKDDADFERTAGRVAEGLQAA